MADGLIIGGVGRSGTSTAAALAEVAGLRPPHSADLISGNEWNPDGYWESASLVDFNNRLLAATGQNWWKPCRPERNTCASLAANVAWTNRAAQIFRQVFGAERGWLWKDPRLTVLLPFWDRVLGVQPLLVPYRDPVEVAASISRRDKLSIDVGLAIWERHSRLMLTTAAGHPALFAGYADLTERPHTWFGQLIDFCGHSGLEIREQSLAASGRVHRITRRSVEAKLSSNQSDLAAIITRMNGPHSKFQAPILPEETPNTQRLIDSLPKVNAIARLRSQLYVRARPGDLAP